MALFDRIAQTPGAERRVPVHRLTAMLREYARGFVTKADIQAALGMVADDTPNLDAMLAKLDGAGNLTAKLLMTLALDDICILTEGRVKYLTQADWNTRIGAL